MGCPRVGVRAPFHAEPGVGSEGTVGMMGSPDRGTHPTSELALSNFSVRVMGRSTAEEDEAGGRASSQPASQTFCGESEVLMQSALMQSLADDMFGDDVVDEANTTAAEPSKAGEPSNATVRERVPGQERAEVSTRGREVSGGAWSLSMASMNADMQSSQRRALQAEPISVAKFRKHVRWGGLCFRKLTTELIFLDSHACLHKNTLYVGYGMLAVVWLAKTFLQPAPIMFEQYVCSFPSNEEYCA